MGVGCWVGTLDVLVLLLGVFDEAFGVSPVCLSDSAQKSSQTFESPAEGLEVGGVDGVYFYLVIPVGLWLDVRAT